MRQILLFIALLAISNQLLSQTRTVTGQLLDELGEPFSYVQVLIKGTATGTVTDIDGNYSIEAPVGSILIFSFIGYATQEMRVTETDLVPVGKNVKRSKDTDLKLPEIPAYLHQNDTSAVPVGVGVLKEGTQTYKLPRFKSIRSIKSITTKEGQVKVKMFRKPPDSFRNSLKVHYTLGLGLETINRLPELQSEFSQGRSVNGSLRWRGPETQEIHSWGPALSTLGFDGSDYRFDQNGRLIPIGNGPVSPANVYDPTAFFTTGALVSNELKILAPGPEDSKILLTLEHRQKSGVIPNADYTRTNANLDVEDITFAADLLSADATVIYSRSRGNLLERGGNLTAIMGSVYRTPVSFDNTNGLSSADALDNPSSYEQVGGLVRTHAPGMVDNPYGLVNSLPDNELSDRLITGLSLRTEESNLLDLELRVNADLQWNRTVFGLPPGYAGTFFGRRTERNLDQKQVTAELNWSPRIELFDQRLDIVAGAGFAYNQVDLARIDGFSFASLDAFGDINQARNLFPTNRLLDRQIYEAFFMTTYHPFDGMKLRLGNRAYFSSTVEQSQFSNFQPSVGFKYDLYPLLGWGNHDIWVYTNFSRSIREAPLWYNNWSYLSTSLPLPNYASFDEGNELFFSEGVAPEIETKLELGLGYSLNGNLDFSFNYYTNRTKDFIAPGRGGTGIALSNLLTLQNQGVDLSLSHSIYSGDFFIRTSINWSSYNTSVLTLNEEADPLPLAGFVPVQTRLVEREPFGVIYGSAYVRDNDGQIFIGADGFPLKNPELSRIGNPIPDWIGGISVDVEWKQWSLNMAIDVRNGGDVWNGTQATLDFLGRSATTGQLRNTTGYVFDGVTVNGQPNTIPVDFYDPSRTIFQNRWTRYGWEGISEEYIEEASWVRLNNLIISYELNKPPAPFGKMEFSFEGRNLLLITSYSGIDPNSNLFGYATGNGLDYFNMPAVRSYALRVSITLD